MKLEELTPRINLTEVFDSSADIEWSTVDGNQHRGKFKLDEHEYMIHIDEYDLFLESSTAVLLDLGFSYGDISQKMTNINKNTSKILGIVSKGIANKIKNIKYDILLFGAAYKNGNVESRMKIYYHISKKYFKEGMTKYDISDITKKHGKYILLSNIEITDKDMQKIKENINKG